MFIKNESVFSTDILASLFANSQTSGQLLNITSTDYGSQIEKAQVSLGNIPVGIHKRGSQKTNSLFSRKTPILWHDNNSEVYQIFKQLKQQGNYYASARNFTEKVIMNFGPEDLFITLTFNNRADQLKFTRAPWSPPTCPFPNCQNSHTYQTLPAEITTFLAEKRTSQKHGRELDGVNDLLLRFIQTIQTQLQPTNFRWVAVPELHDCQTPCHQKRRKSKNKKKNRLSHNPAFCRCSEKHDCRQNWHIHLVISNFFPPELTHAKCGLAQNRGCWDHRFNLAHFWPYGLADLKKISHLRNHGRPLKTPEAIVKYLAKYLIKNFNLRTQPELAQKHGLLPNMALYKFFRVIYDYSTNPPRLIARIKKPRKTSSTFINSNPLYQFQAEHELKSLITTSKNGRLLVKKPASNGNPPPIAEKPDPISLIKLCHQHATKGKITQNQAWKPCELEAEKTRCEIATEHHTNPIIRWEFTFNGSKSYQAYRTLVLPLIKRLNLPTFTKFKDYQPNDQEQAQFNQLLNEPRQHYRETQRYLCDESELTEAIYNTVYLGAIRQQINGGYQPQQYAPTYEQAAKRYADY